MNKRGQFYLIAAIVIVSLIVGFFTITNSAEQKESTKVYDLSEDLGIEGNQVLDFGLIQQSSSDSSEKMSLKDLFENFTNKYSQYVSDSNIKIFFIFGNSTAISVVSYNELSGSFSIGDSSIPIKGGKNVQTVVPKEDKITVIIDDIEYSFKLKPGENFYYIISQENSDGTKEVRTSNENK